MVVPDISLSTLMFVFATILMLAMLMKKRITPNRKNAYETNYFDISYYGIYCGISFLIILLYFHKCNLSPIKITLAVFASLILTMFNCQKCRKEYHYIAVYQYFLPVFLLFFNCSEIGKILTGIAITSSIGRLGCSSAGCCNGKIVDCNHKFAMKFNDPKQLVNKLHNTPQICTLPTNYIESFIGFIMAGLCLKFPKYAVPIFSIFSISQVLLSVKLREGSRRNKPNLAYLMLCFISILCFKIESPLECNNIVNNNYYKMAIITLSIIVVFIFSNDINVKNIQQLRNKKKLDYDI